MELTTTAAAPQYNFDPPATTAPPATQDAARLIADVTTISRATTWSGNQRSILTAMVVNTPVDSLTGYRVMEKTSAAKIAKLTGISETTVDETIRVFRDTNPPVINWQVNDRFYDKNGKPIEKAQYNKKKGDKWFSDVIIAIPRLPATLPTLIEGKHAKACKEASASYRRDSEAAKAKLQVHLDTATCPHCGEVGTLRVHIGSTCACGCGAILDEAETEQATGQDNFATEHDPLPKVSGGGVSPKNKESLTNSPKSGVGSGDGSTEGGRRQSVDPQEFEKEFFGNLDNMAGTKEVNRG